MKTTTLALALLLATSLASAATAPAKAEPPPTPTDLTAPASDAVKSATGLATKQLAAGTGTAKPTDADYVKIRFAMWTSDGKLVDFITPQNVAIVAVPKLMPGVREAMVNMVEGERVRAWIPESLGTVRGEPKGGLVIADLELVSIVPTPKTPEDLAAPPADATRTRSGLAYKVLRPGTGTKHPRSNGYVRVHYTGWTTDGKMFDSSVLRGNPAEFGLDGVIAGWREGLQLMTEGEVTRFWIPSKLAYGREAGKPQGTLVFDIELIDVE